MAGNPFYTVLSSWGRKRNNNYCASLIYYSFCFFVTFSLCEIFTDIPYSLLRPAAIQDLMGNFSCNAGARDRRYISKSFINFEMAARIMSMN